MTVLDEHRPAGASIIVTGDPVSDLLVHDRRDSRGRRRLRGPMSATPARGTKPGVTSGAVGPEATTV
jgi:hypothetical protein